MKKADLFQSIRAAADKDLPDVFAKIDLDKIAIIPESEPIKKPRFVLQSVLVYSLSALIVFVGLFWAMTELSTDNLPNYTPLETEAEIIGYQTLSATTLLESLEPVDLSFSLLTSTTTPSEPLVASEIDTVNAYVNMLEITLGSENSMIYTLEESDLTQYQTMISFQGLGLAGETISYRFYYNATDESNERQIQGVISFMEHEYPASGAISLDDAALIRSTFRVMIDDDNYVEIDDTSTADSQQFAYRIYQGAALYNASQIKLNSSKNALRAEINYQFGGKNLSFQIEKNHSQNALSINYEITGDNSEAGAIDINVEYDEDSGIYRYRYQVKNSAGQSQGEYQGNRRNKNPNTSGNDDEDDEDDEGEGTTTTDPGTNPGPGPGTQNPSHGNFL